MSAGLIERFVAPVVPPERLATLRVLVGTFGLVYLLARVVDLTSSPAHAKWAPVLLTRLLAGPAPHAALLAVFVLAIVSGLAFVVGYRFRVAGPAFSVSLLFLLSHRNSFGMVFHTENLLVLHALVLAFTDAAAAMSLDACRAARPARPSQSFGAAVQLISLITALSYVLAGVAKLRVSGLAWATGDILRNHVAYDNLRKLLLGDSHSPLGVWAATHAWVFRPFAVLTLVVELLAPLALLGGRLAKGWVLVMWSFHAGVLALMWIFFPYQLFFIAFASFLPAERLFPWLGSKLSR